MSSSFSGEVRSADLKAFTAMHQCHGFAIPRVDGLGDVNLGKKSFPGFGVIRRIYPTGFQRTSSALNVMTSCRLPVAGTARDSN